VIGTAHNAPAQPAAGSLAARAGSALVLASVALAAAWIGGWAATVMISLAAVIVLWEWISITEGKNLRALAYALPVVGALVLWTMGLPAWSAAAAVLAVVLALPGQGAPWRAIGVFYALLLGLGPLIIRLSPDNGWLALLFVLAVVWTTDTAAYFTGRAIGGPKLWASVSPKKTWSGAIGGLIGGVLAGLLVVTWSDGGMSVQIVFLAVGVSAVSQLGDLFESAVKRRFGAKDSGGLIPGHGGLMDRVDGFIVAAALAAVVGWLRFPDSPATGLLQW
jgi:phosphatidate cytidylyltransferase